MQQIELNKVIEIIKEAQNNWNNEGYIEASEAAKVIIERIENMYYNKEKQQTGNT